ncbi:MAG: hypothetical protein U0T84_02850 [Chitinophagales bacterium]
MKRTLGLLLLVGLLFAGYLAAVKPQPPVFEGLEQVSIDTIGQHGWSLKGTVVFKNPNSMRTQLGVIEFSVSVNGQPIGTILQEVNSGISKGGEFRLPFQLRYTSEEVVLQAPYHISLHGQARSNTLLGNYTVAMDREEDFAGH